MKLLEPVKIGKLELRNRIVMLPISTGYSTTDGSVTQRMIDFYAERANGGAALLRTEPACVAETTGVLTTHLGIWDDKQIAGLRKLAQGIQAGGAKASVQLYHTGRAALPEITGKPPVAFSDYPFYLGGDTKPKILTAEEIDELAGAFAEGARRAREAGFDAVEIHGAHGFLVNQSLSPLTNKRTDRYGGDFEGRMRFSLEIIRRARDKVGSDFPIIFRMSGQENYAGGYSLDYGTKIAQRLEQAGVNIICVSTGAPAASYTPLGYFPPGCLLHLAEGVKKVVKVPVVALGRINDPNLAEKILQEGKADLIGMARALIADPQFPKKVAEGRLDDIIPCIVCDHCEERIGISLEMYCVANTEVGREREFRITPAQKPKKVIVIGGGPAGMEAARVAALRGHKVTLYEKSAKLGGQFRLACIPPGKQEIHNLIEYLTNQMTKLGVKIELGREITPALIEEIKPDSLIVATGAKPLIPEIPGVNRDSVVTANDVLLGVAKVGRRIIVIGGGEVGIETADFLVDKGKDVTIVEMLGRIGMDLGVVVVRWFMTKRIAERGVKSLTNTKVVEITDKGVIASRDGKRETLEADTIVLAVGSESCKELVKQLEGKVPELHAIGDCVEPRKAADAIYEGSQVARII